MLMLSIDPGFQSLGYSLQVFPLGTSGAKNGTSRPKREHGKPVTSEYSPGCVAPPSPSRAGSVTLVRAGAVRLHRRRHSLTASVHLHRDLVDALRRDGIDPQDIEAVVVEEMQVYPRGRSRPNDILAVQLVGGFVAGAICAASGASFHPVLAATWKGQIPKNVLHTRILREIERHGWTDRITAPTKATLADATHATGLGWWWAATRSAQGA